MYDAYLEHSLDYYYLNFLIETAGKFKSIYQLLIS